MEELDSASNNNRAYQLITIVAITLALALSLLGSRFYVRMKITKNPGWDDFFIVLAVMTVLVAVGMGMTAIHYGLGRHIYVLPEEHITTVIKWDYVQSLPLGLAAMFTKISIFFFLRRLFLTTQTKWTWNWTLHFINGVNIAANIASASTVLPQCSPVKKLWDPTVPGSCWSPDTQRAVGIFQGVTSAFCDFAFSFLPIVFLWNVHISFRIKFGICSLMGLGFFTGVCAIVRTVVANTEDYEDITYNDLIWNIWIYMETMLGIVAACLPTVRPLLKTQFIKSYITRYYSSGFLSRKHVTRGRIHQDQHGFIFSSIPRETPVSSGTKGSESRVTMLV